MFCILELDDVQLYVLQLNIIPTELRHAYHDTNIATGIINYTYNL